MTNYYFLQAQSKGDFDHLFYKIRNLKIMRSYSRNLTIINNLLIIKDTFPPEDVLEAFQELSKILPEKTKVCQITHHEYETKMVYAGYDNSQDILPLDYSRVKEKPSYFFKKGRSNFGKLERNISAYWIISYLYKNGNDVFADVPFRLLSSFYRQTHDEDFWFNGLDTYKFIIVDENGNIKLTNGFYDVLLGKKFSKIKKEITFSDLVLSINSSKFAVRNQYRCSIDEKDIDIFVNKIIDGTVIFTR